MKPLAPVLLAALLAGCGGEPPPAEPTKPPAPPAAPMTDAALPVTAPMQARDRLLHDLEERSRAARDRAAKLDQAIGGGR